MFFSPAPRQFSSHLYKRRRFILFLSICFLAVAISAITLPSNPLNGMSFAKSRDDDPPPLTVVSAASFGQDSIAAESMLTAFGENLSTTTAAATDVDPDTPGVQLPTTLGGTTMRINGTPAPLLYVSPTQINFVMPEDIEPSKDLQDLAMLEVLVSESVVAEREMFIWTAAPAVFTYDGNGTGVPTAVAVHVKANGELKMEPLVELEQQSGRLTPRPLELSQDADRVFLAIFLSGIRRANDPNHDGNLNESVRVKINGYEFPVTYAGRQKDFAGMDQVNFEIPKFFLGSAKLAIQIVTNDEGRNHTTSGFSYPTTEVVSNTTEVFLKIPPVTQAKWRESGLNGLDVHSFVASGQSIVAGASDGFYVSYDEGGSWQEPIYIAPYSKPKRAVLTMTNLFWGGRMAGLRGYGVWNGNGESWLTSGFDYLSLGYKDVLSLADDGRYVFAGTGGQGVYRKTSPPTGFPPPSWELASSGLANLKVSALTAIPGRVFAGTDGGGIWVSADEGANWVVAGEGIPADAQVLALAMTGQTVYAGTNTGVWRSDDSGATWGAFNQGLPETSTVNTILVHGPNLFIGTAGSGVFVSQDKGASWNAMNDGLAQLNVLSLAAGNGVLFAGTLGGGVYTATLLAGSNAPPVANPQTVALDEDTTVRITLTGSDPDGDPISYLIVRGPASGKLTGTAPNLLYTPSENFFGEDQFIFRTMDGKSGSRIATVTLKVNSIDDPIEFSVEGRAHAVVGGAVVVYGYGFDPDGDEVKITADSLPSGAVIYEPNIYHDKSRASFQVRWTPTDVGTYTIALKATGVNGTSQTKGYTVTVADNPEKAAWSRIAIPDEKLVTNILVVDTTLYTVAYDQRNYTFDSLLRSIDNGQNWTKIGNGLPAADARFYALVGDAAALYAATSEGLYRSSDGGANWSNIGQSKGLPSDGKLVVSLTADGDRVLVGMQQGVYLSLDRGETWKNISKGLPLKPNDTPNPPPVSVLSTGISGNALLVGTSFGFLFGASLAFRSVDNGESWEPIEAGLGETDLGSYEDTREFLSADADLFARKYHHFLRSADNGLTWNTLTAGLLSEHPEINRIQAMSVRSGLLLLSTQDYGVYLSRDDANSWWPINLGLPNLDYLGVSINRLAINKTHLFAVTRSGEVFLRPLQ